MDGYADTARKNRDQLTTESFLRGCREKEAAYHAMEKEPSMVQKALKYIRASLAIQRASG